MQSWEEQSQGAIYTVEYACRYGRPLQAGGAVLSGTGLGLEMKQPALGWHLPGESREGAVGGEAQGAGRALRTSGASL